MALFFYCFCNPKLILALCFIAGWLKTSPERPLVVAPAVACLILVAIELTIPLAPFKAWMDIPELIRPEKPMTPQSFPTGIANEVPERGPLPYLILPHHAHSAPRLYTTLIVLSSPAACHH
jgi:hypothetical protein